MVKSAELKPWQISCPLSKQYPKQFGCFSPFENTNLRYIFEFSLSVWLRSMSLCREYWSRTISWLKWFAWSWQITTLWFSHDWGSFYDLIRKWKKIWGGESRIPTCNSIPNPLKTRASKWAAFLVLSRVRQTSLLPHRQLVVFFRNLKVVSTHRRAGC